MDVCGSRPELGSSQNKYFGFKSDLKNKTDDLDRIRYIYSDDNSNELIGRLSINGIMDDSSDDIFNGLIDQSDVVSSLT